MTGPYVPTGSTVTPLEKVERELAQQLKKLQGPGEMPVQIARMSNLIVFCDDRAVADKISAVLPEIVSSHPARVLLLVGEPIGAIPIITASVLVRPLGSGPHHSSFCEQVSLHAAGDGVGRLPFAVRTLLVGDLPTNLWWASNVPPPMGGTLLHDLGEHVQQIVYDSLGWREPAKGVAATASWLKQVEMTMPGGRWRVASDLNWRRLKYWRRLLAQTFEANTGTVESATELLVEHGPHAVIEAWELVSWLDAPSGKRRTRIVTEPPGFWKRQSISTPDCTLPPCTCQPRRRVSQLTSSHASITACGPCSTRRRSFSSSTARMR